MTTQTQSRRIFGAPEGAAGVRVVETTGINILPQPNLGTCAVLGNLKRGPSGVFVPVNSWQEYQTVFGDPSDPFFHLYADGSHQLPDFATGFFSAAGNQASLYICRLELDREGRPATREMKNRFGTPVLRFHAANEGAWGGAKKSLPYSPVVFATSRTFTVYAPEVKGNEFIGAIAEFGIDSGKQYQIIANSKANDRGEVIFTVSSQYDLFADGVSGPVALTGLANYTRDVNLTGTVSFILTANVTGTVNINDTVVTGVGTAFTTELKVGDNIYYQGELRVIESISSDTTLTIESTFSNNASGVTIQRDNKVLQGTGTSFTTELVAGAEISIVLDGVKYTREVDRIISDTEVQLVTGFADEVPAGTQSSTVNYWVIGSGMDWSELQTGNVIIDPNRSGESVQVVEIDSANDRFRVSRQFSRDFVNAQLTKQNQQVLVTLDPPVGQGLTVEVGLGTRKPLTHFSLNIFFNGSLVMRIPDASLDPNDEDFVDTLVNEGNIAYRDAGRTYNTYINCETLFTGSYTTAETNDIRPVNGYGVVAGIEGNRLYTVSDFDPSIVSARYGGRIFVNPYAQARQSFRVRSAVRPVELEGVISTTGVDVFGVNTNFTDVFQRGDYLYDPISQTIRQIRAVVDDSRMILFSIFPADLPGGTQGYKAGYLQADLGVELSQFTDVGKSYILSHPQALENGYDGDLSQTSAQHFITYLNPDSQLLQKAIFGRNLGLVRIACPGRYDVSVQSAGGSYAALNAFEYRIEFPPNLNTSAAAEAFINIDLGRDDFYSAAFPSHGYIANPFGRGKRFVTLNGDLMGIESLYAATRQGWHYPAAGIDARLNRIEELSVTLSPADQADLNNTGIQPIIRMFGRTIPYGVEGPAIDPMYRFLHVRRIQSNYVRIFLEHLGLLRSIFRPNQPELALQIRMMLDNFFREEYRKGVFNNYMSYQQAVSIQVNESTGSSSLVSESLRDNLVAIANGEMKINISYFVTGVVKQIDIELGPDIVTAQYGN